MQGQIPWITRNPPSACTRRFPKGPQIARNGGFHRDSRGAGTLQEGAKQKGDHEKGRLGGTGTKTRERRGAVLAAHGTTAGVPRGSRSVPLVRIGTHGDRGTLRGQNPLHSRSLTRGEMHKGTSGERMRTAGGALGTAGSGPLPERMTGSGDMEAEEAVVAGGTLRPGPHRAGTGVLRKGLGGAKRAGGTQRTSRVTWG